MFLAVWMLYAADRLLDARSSSEPTDLEERHRFHERHRTAFLWVIAAAAVLLAALVARLPEASLRLYAVLGSLLAAYFFLIHISPADIRRARLPKELAVGLFFSAAVFIPTVARAPMLRRSLLPDSLLFAAICTLNCLFVYTWEHPSERASAHWTTRWATRHLALISVAIILCGSATACAARINAGHAHLPALAPIGIACTLAIALLLALHAFRNRVSATNLRAAADLVLLAPLLLLPWT